MNELNIQDKILLSTISSKSMSNEDSVMFSENPNLNFLDEIREFRNKKIELEMQNEELKNFKENLKIHTEKFTKLFEVAPVGYFVLTKDGKITDVNRNGAQLLGFSQIELSKMKFSYFIKKNNKEIFYNFLQKVFESNIKQNCEIVVGLTSEMNCTIMIYGIVFQKDMSCLISAFDITEKNNIEQTLIEKGAEVNRQKAMFESLMKNIQIGVFMVEAPSGKPILANEAAFEILGRGILPDTNTDNLNEVYKSYKLHSHTQYPIDEMPIILGMNGISAYIDDMMIERPDGKQIMLEIYGSPVSDSSGNIWASVVSFSDITKRKTSELALIASESKFRNYIENAPCGIFVIDKSGYFQDTNNLASKLFGYSSEEFKEIFFPQLIHKDSEKIIIRLISILSYDRTYQNEIKFTRKDGSTFFGLLKVIKINEKHYLGFINDISDRKKIESGLLESEFKLRTMADNAFDWEYWEAEDKSIVYMSPSCERMTGYSPKDFIANPNLLLSIIHPDDLELVTKHNQRIHSREYADISEVIEFKVVSKDCSIVYVEHICKPVYDEVENYFGRRITNRDITERKWAEQELINVKKQKDIILENELKEKENQLMKFAKSMQERDDYLFKIKNMLEQGKSMVEKNNKLLANIGKNISMQLQNNDDWLLLEEEFFKINPMFMTKLSTNYTNLTLTEIRICAMIKLNLRSKEIANLLNISQKTVDNHRLNIRKKLDIDDHTQLSCFLMKY